MKLFTIVTLLCFVSLKAFCQEENVIKFKSEVTLTLSETEKGKYSYKITEVKNFDQTVEDSQDLFKGKVDSNQVKLFFCPGKFGYDVKNLLIIKSGLKGFLKYTAKIKREGDSQFKTTSVEPLFPNVKSIEEWPYAISAIILSDFSLMKH